MSRTTSLSGSLARAACAAGAALALVLPITQAASAVARPAAVPLFATPSSIASIGHWIVVADHGSSTLTVLAASDGALLRDVSHSLLGVPEPTSVVAETVGGRRLVFVAGTGGHVAELSFVASGASVGVSRLRVLHPIGCAAKAPAFLALDANHHVVEVCANGVVTEWRASMGTMVRTISASKSHVTNATGLATLGADVAITNAATSSSGSASDGVTELSLATGARIRTVSNATNPAYGFSEPGAISSDGTNLWVVNTKANTVDELSGTLGFLGSSGTNLSDPNIVLATPAFVWVSSGSWTGGASMVTQFQVVDHALQSPWMMCNSNGPYKFDNPSGFAVSGSSLWVANATDNLVDQMSASTGALVATYT